MTLKCSLGHENVDGAAFCDECGEPLPLEQPSMGGQNDMNAIPPVMVNNLVDQKFSQQDSVNAVQPSPMMDNNLVDQKFKASLFVVSSNLEIDISNKDRVTLGREDAAGNIFPVVDLTPHGGEEGGVSRQHATIFSQNNQWMIEDNNSTNYTFVNNQRVMPGQPMALPVPECEVKLGRVVLRFKQEPETQQALASDAFAQMPAADFNPMPQMGEPVLDLQQQDPFAMPPEDPKEPETAF